MVFEREPMLQSHFAAIRLLTFNVIMHLYEYKRLESFPRRVRVYCFQIDKVR